jgi:hypothetical protein
MLLRALYDAAGRPAEATAKSLASAGRPAVTVAILGRVVLRHAL